MTHPLLHQLRAVETARQIGPLAKPDDQALLAEWDEAGVAFVASSDRLTQRYYDAVRELFDCIKPTVGDTPILHEGGVYHGCWLESTGTINADLLSRFLPSISTATYSALASNQRDDGMLPYKLTADGAGFSQIQLVTPLARCVWNHYRLHNLSKDWLADMYRAMTRYDDWLVRFRNTRGTAAVEAFSTYDTGHDLSSRFWHVPDSPHQNDARLVDPDSPILPFVAPDLTANVACQRDYLGRIASELDEDAGPWAEKADTSRRALFDQCYDGDDGFFYDRDKNNALVRVQSDVLLRVLACEIGDDDFFASALKRYLLNTRKFFAKYPFTSIALDDPRFDPAFDYNSWGGPSNFLSIIRAPHAFEHHGRHVELTWVHYPILAALFDMDSFPQCLSPFTGAAGYTEKYSPAILCLLDFVERLCGILPRPDGEVWFTSLVPKAVKHKETAHETAYRRIVGGKIFELLNLAEGSEIYRDGERIFAFPAGIRLICDPAGDLLAVVGMVARTVTGAITTPQGSIPISITGNERWNMTDTGLVRQSTGGWVSPSYD